MKFGKLALAAMTTMVLAACGGDGEVKPFIKGLVNGTSFQATEDLGGHYHGSNNETLHIWGDIVQSGNSLGYWDMEFPAAVGTYPCGEDDSGNWTGIELGDNRGGSSVYYYADGEEGSSCSITVTRVGEKEVAGTFTATLLQEESATTVNVTKGSFRVPFDPND